MASAKLALIGEGTSAENYNVIGNAGILPAVTRASCPRRGHATQEVARQERPTAGRYWPSSLVTRLASFTPLSPLTYLAIPR